MTETTWQRPSRKIGIVEGFYGRPYSWAERDHLARVLREEGGGFYIYAPKGDPFLRKRWKEKLPKESAAELRRFGAELHRLGLSFGVGLSPYECYRSFDSATRSALKAKLDEVTSLGADHVAMLFDDMRGDLPDLAKLQSEIMKFTRENCSARLSFCPTYYTPDPILDRVFGKRPERYLEDIGTGIDSNVAFHWTGDKVCSTRFDARSLAELSTVIRRKPLLWDNYPVNDGQRMCKFLHLRAFSGRPAELADVIAEHAVNPMNQPYLSEVPLRSLFRSYREGSHYQPERAWKELATRCWGEGLAALIEENLALFNDRGLDSMTETRKTELMANFATHAHPAAREILHWLRGEYQVTRELVLTQ